MAVDVTRQGDGPATLLTDCSLLMLPVAPFTNMV